MTSFRNAPYCLIILPQVRVEDPLNVHAEILLAFLFIQLLIKRKPTCLHAYL